ncbi:MAG: hypothetical protein DWQ48_07440 [Bacteroidetes bacterium]|nr:MAG: hypothetical protein DWQ48_07440 [Bacteroidota bacterium]
MMHKDPAFGLRSGFPACHQAGEGKTVNLNKSLIKAIRFNFAAQRQLRQYAVLVAQLITMLKIKNEMNQSNTKELHLFLC